MTRVDVPPFYEEEVAEAMRDLLKSAGQDITREGLRDTPARYARFLKKWCHPEPFEWTDFDAEGASQMIVQENIPFYSLCEHHLLPFVGKAVVAYLPNARIVGLSKLARAVQHAAAGLQNQERITRCVADMVEEHLKPRGVGVVLRAEHLCMTMRGAQAVGSLTTTSDLRGAFRDDMMTRAEFQSWVAR